MSQSSQDETIKCIEGYVNPQSEESKKTSSLNSILLGLVSKRIDIQDIVLGLGDYLNTKDSILRARGTLLLSEVLCRLPDYKLNQDQIHFLSMFYCDRLQDTPCAAEVVKEVHPSSLTHAHRKMVLQIIEIMFNKCLGEIQELKNDFMVGYLQFIDNEKDPRNLIYSFKLMPKVIYNIPEHKNFLESLFEILSCYFPISFNPKGNDPNAITRDDLSNSLLNCFSCTPLFAEYSIPFLIDKICSNLVETKIEALKALVYCCDRYGGEAIRPFLEDIWSALRTQILTHKNASVIEESKKTIFYLCKSLTKDQKVLESFLAIMIRECLHHIKSSQDSKIAIYCASILYQAISSSLLSSKIILIHVLPNLFKFFKELQQEDSVTKTNEQNSVLGLFSDLLKANSLAFDINSTSDTEVINPLTPFVEQLYQLFTDLLVNPSSAIRASSIECLSFLYISKKVKTNENGENEFLLDIEKRQVIIKNLVSLLNENDSTLRHKSLESLFNIASNENPKVINEYAIPTLLQMINSVHTDSTTTDQLKDLKNYLEAFSKLCTHQPLLESVIPQIQILIQHNIKDTYQNEQDFQKCILILKAISSILEKSTNQVTMTICSDSILLPLIKGLYKQIIFSSPTTFNLDYFNQILTASLKMIHSIVENTSLDSQTKKLYSLIDLFLKGDLKVLGFTDDEISNKQILPFENNITKENENIRLLIPIFTTCISQSKSDLSSNDQLKQSLYEMSLNTNVSETTSISCNKAYASILNKQPDDVNNYPTDFEFFENNLIKVIKSPESPIEYRIRCLDLLTWCTKALLTNGNKINIQLGNCISDIISTVTDSNEITSRASKSFDILLDNTDVLNEKSGSVIKILYDQKFFTLMFPILLESFKKYKATPSISSHYLMAISYLLRHVPKEVLLSELNEILPIVMQSLKSNDSNSLELLESSLQTLKMLINETPNSFISYLDSLIPSLIQISVKSPQYNLRRLALEILTLISKLLPFHNLFQFKQDVTTGIIPCLDDKKRIVRKQASNCRNNWFILQK
ncbi:hypothetical protein DICPUDRAFT_86559 [Dictyostelium purpureum]|uniref:MMS19 nucleotide excision repair protein n=1 Tax=Dictyostelium purpureum TaxID=5786 RepID=F0ZCI4_DICPU|nr:uncharacterized protein DICPUDRAFT_86559 [Dictyostelium purpureum]EGC38352.1 hypothetical protein DICPUDRAFT_86559 [Dictyostelium purpureum]|eukprot:XP_003285109.1 hypothetical protein DICPUDRAFT_86559 [Dictyostelium purpureum]